MHFELVYLLFHSFHILHGLFFTGASPPLMVRGGAEWEVHRRLQYPARHYPHLGRGRVATFAPEDMLACITMVR